MVSARTAVENPRREVLFGGCFSVYPESDMAAVLPAAGFPTGNEFACLVGRLVALQGEDNRPGNKRWAAATSCSRHDEKGWLGR